MLAPGPVLGDYFPIGGYFARTDWVAQNPGLAEKFRTAMNQSLQYSQTHPDEVRDLLPAASQNIRLPIWTTLLDRQQLLELARLREEVRRHHIAAQPDPARAELDLRRVDLQGTVGNQFITLRKDGKLVTR